MLEGLTSISILFILNIIAGVLLTVLPFWFICRRVGLHPALSIFSLVPLANIIFLFYLAFGRWPVLEEQDVQKIATAPLHDKKSDGKVLITIGALLLVIALIIPLTGTIYTFSLPKIYASEARIQINHDPVDIDPFNQPSPPNGGSIDSSYFLRTQCEIIRSKPVLYEVINRLNLQEAWGKDGNPIPKQIAYKILFSSLNVQTYRDTSLVSIQVQRTNPNEAMQIANELADTYRDQRLNRKHEKMTRAVNAIRRELEKQEKKVADAEQQVEKLRKELDLPAYAERKDPGEIDQVQQKQLESDLTEARVQMLPFNRARQELEIQQSIMNALQSRLDQEGIISKAPRAPVEIVDSAGVPIRPVSPNLVLNIMLSLGLSGLFAVIGIPILVIGLRRRTR